MRTAAIVPAKGFGQSKRRLRARYGDAQAAEIARALLEDVLDALHEAKGVDYLGVLTDDDEVASAAHAAGADVRLRRPDPGLNPAIENASRELADDGYEAVLVVLGDLPGLRAADIEEVIAAGKTHPVVLVPSNDGGTAMLLRHPPQRIPVRFGPASAAAHQQAALDAGVPVRILSSPGGGALLDLDTPEDADRFLEKPVPCRTRRVLERLGR